MLFDVICPGHQQLEVMRTRLGTSSFDPGISGVEREEYANALGANRGLSEKERLEDGATTMIVKLGTPDRR